MLTKTQPAQRCDRKKADGRLSQPVCEDVQDEMMMNTVPSPADANLETYRPRLFGIAFRMLGDVHDAEDLVQETMLRWQKTERASVREPEAWLVAVVTRLAIDRLRQAQTKRAQYPGPWLPEPVAEERLSPEYRSELASDLSMAFLVLLERLAPEERAAFLLRDVFGCEYDEIARALGKSQAAARPPMPCPITPRLLQELRHEIQDVLVVQAEHSPDTAARTVQPEGGYPGDDVATAPGPGWGDAHPNLERAAWPEATFQRAPMGASSTTE